VPAVDGLALVADRDQLAVLRLDHRGDQRVGVLRLVEQDEVRRQLRAPSAQIFR
jgi:hypothetical protein